MKNDLNKYLPEYYNIITSGVFFSSGVFYWVVAQNLCAQKNKKMSLITLPLLDLKMTAFLFSAAAKISP